MFQFFDRPAMKAQAKANLKRSYWPAFFVSLLIYLALGGSVSFSTGTGFTFNFDLSGMGGTQEYYYNNDPFFGAPDHTGMLTALFIFLIVFFVIFTVVLLMQLAKTIFAGHVLQVGGARFYLNHARGEGKIYDLSHAFGVKGKAGYFNVVKVMFQRALRLFLWELPMIGALAGFVSVIVVELSYGGEEMSDGGTVLLLITILLILASIPLEIVRAVKYYQYSMIPYLLAEYPEMTTAEVFAASKELTDGHKGDLFVVDLSFIGWQLLAGLCLGIGHFFLAPYIDATYAQAYISLCSLQQQKRRIAAAPANNPYATAPVTAPVAQPAVPTEQPSEQSATEEPLPAEQGITEPEAPETTGEE